MSSIKVYVIGAVHMVGKALKGAGEPYDFANVSYLTSSSSMSNSYMRRRSIGKEKTDVSISNDHLDSVLSSLEKFTFPCDLELELAPDSRNVTNNVVVAVKDIPYPVAPDAPINDLNADGTKKTEFSKKFGV